MWMSLRLRRTWCFTCALCFAAARRLLHGEGLPGTTEPPARAGRLLNGGIFAFFLQYVSVAEFPIQCGALPMRSRFALWPRAATPHGEGKPSIFVGNLCQVRFPHQKLHGVLSPVPTCCSHVQNEAHHSVFDGTSAGDSLLFRHT